MRALSGRETRTAHLWHRLFGSWAAAAVRRPRTTIALSLLVAAAALALSASHLTLKTSNLDLVDPGLPPVADFRAFAERFGTPNMLVVVLEGNDEATLHDAVDRVVEHARRAPGVRSVVGRLPYEPGDLALLGVDPYFAARDRRAFYVFVQPADAASSAQTIGPFAAAVRRAIADSGAAALGVRIGTTGLPQYALDDRTVIQHDISRLSALSFVVVLAVFALGFAEFMRPVLAMAGLTVAAAAMMGVAALAPGHLTLLSAFFLSALFGLGSDYGIFVIDAFEERLAAGEEKAAALVGAVRFLAPGLATETFATAAAFLTLAFSGFRGFAELGWIAAVGLLLSLLAMVVLLPALLVLHRGGGRRREKPLAERRLGRLLLALQHPALAAGLAALALAGLAAGLPAFDGDYLALQPRDSEAVRLERAMVAGSDFSPVAAAFTVDSPEAAAALAERLRGEEEVGGARSLADLAPLDAFATPLAEERAAFGRSFASADGHYAVYAYPAGDLWDPQVESRFLARMRAVDPRVTGMPVLGRFMIDLSRRALVRTGLLATAVVLLLVVSEIGFSRWALVAVTPTLLGVAAMLGAMRLLGVAWNPINVMALPVVIGTAVDAGIHVTHRFLVDRGNLVAAVAGSGRAVLLSSLTTLAGFGALVFTSHRGLASFATVLVVGVLAGLVLSLFLLPQLLRLAWHLERGESAERPLAG